MRVYIVTAYRHGNRYDSSFLVGVFTDRQCAIGIAQQENQVRLGTFACEVMEVGLDPDLNTEPDFMVVFPLSSLQSPFQKETQ